MLDRAQFDPFLERFFSRIPREVAASFDEAQLSAIRLAFADGFQRRHSVDLRLSLPLPFRRCYLIVLLGPERRAGPRRRLERRHHPLATAVNVATLSLILGILASAVLGILYMLKSAMGIDLVPGLSLGLWSGLKQQWHFLWR